MGKKETANPIEYVVVPDEEGEILDKDHSTTKIAIDDAINAVFENAANRKDSGITFLRIGGAKRNC